MHHEKIQELEGKIEKLESSKNCAEIKSSRLESLVSTLSEDSNVISKELIETQRKMVILEVNEQALFRRYNASLQVEQVYQKEISRLKDDLQSLQNNAGMKINRLSQFLSESKTLNSQLQERLSESVSSVEFNNLENKLNMYISKTKILLEKERDWIVKKTQRDADQVSVLEQANKIHDLTLQLEEHKSLVSNFKQLLAQKNESDEIKKLKEESASLKVQVEILGQRASMADQRVISAQSSEALLRKQLDDADKYYIDSKQETLQLQQELLDHCDKYEGGADKEEYQKTLNELKNKEKYIESLICSIEKYKCISEVSAKQASDLITTKQVDENEKKILRLAVQELQIKDENNLLIGKLRQQIIALESNEIRNTQKMEALNSTKLSLESQILSLEDKIESQDKIINNLRLKTNSRIQTMRKNMASLRMKHSGIILLSNHERACNMLRTIFDQKEKLQKENSRLTENLNDCQNSLKNLEIETSCHDELIASLRQSSKAHERIKAWHDKMIASQQMLSKTKKELERSNDLVNEYKNKSILTNTRLEELEEHITQIENELDRQRLDFETQQEEYDATLALYETERDQIYNAASSIELKDSLPDRSLPIGQQLESAFRMLYERTKQMKLLEFKLADLQKQFDDNRLKIKENENSLLEKDRKLSQMQLELVNCAVKEDEDAFNVLNGSDQSILDKAREREMQVLNSAKETIKSLQRQLTAKEQMVNKYREKLKSIREIKKDDNLLAKNELIAQLTQRDISRFEGKTESTGVKERELLPELNMIEELEKNIEAKDKAILQLQTTVEDQKKEISVVNESLQDLKNKIENIEKETQSIIQEKSASLKKLEDEVETLREQVPKTPVKDLSDVVARLEQEVKLKDLKLKQFSNAIDDLKKKLIHTVKEFAEYKEKSLTESTAISNEMIEAKTKVLCKKIIELESRNKTITESMQKLKTANIQLENELSILSADIVTRNKELTEARSKISNLKLQMEDVYSKKAQTAQVSEASKQTGDKIPVKEIASISQKGGIIMDVNVSATQEKKYQRKITALKTELEATVKFY